MGVMRVAPEAPTQDEIGALEGLTLLEFGASWCGFCKAAQPYVSEVLKQHPEIRHIWIEDGKGQRLGRSYRVKLWPTLILLRDGVEISRIVRPSNIEELIALLSQYGS